MSVVYVLYPIKKKEEREEEKDVIVPTSFAQAAFITKAENGVDILK